MGNGTQFTAASGAGAPAVWCGRAWPSLSPRRWPRAGIYRSANGDRWLLACDPDTARVFVRHEPNLPSGGQVADIEIGDFLITAGNGPEKQELLRLIGTLVRGPAATRSQR
jgi:hypothetical protein